ncbi:MAG TPA: potassium-transporting ATPase subunit KdpC [Candidatus Elarobacter sp.]|jgi:K+-transporting ATPase ATPase C chain
MAATPDDVASRAESTLRHIVTSVLYTIVSVMVLGLVYPVAIWGAGTLLFHHQAQGSLVYDENGKLIGSELVGQRWTAPRYFHGRPSAAGAGYDPTSTGGTNLGPASKKLLDTTKRTLDALRKANPHATGPVPMDLVTSSASGIDPDVSPAGAYYQAPRVAEARRIPLGRVRSLIDAHVVSRQFGVLGEPHVNVFELNRALDAQRAPAR